MNTAASEPEEWLGDTDDRSQRSTPSGVILERFKRMQTLPPHIRSLEDEFFVQSYLRRKRFDS